MDYAKQIGKHIVVLSLLGALILPNAIQFFHLFEKHKHTTCTEQKTHIHKSIEKCEICTLCVSIFNYNLAEYPSLESSKIPKKNEVNFASLRPHSFKITNTQLRAPPYFS